MPLDANLVFYDGSADLTYALVTTATHGQPTSTTRNDGGHAVLDLVNGGPKGGLAVVLVLADSANASDDALTATVEESDEVDFASDVHELGKLDLAAAVTGEIAGSEQPCTIVRRVVPTKRYMRVKMTNVASDDQGTGYCYLTPYPFEKL